jgi:hypothetical protein
MGSPAADQTDKASSMTKIEQRMVVEYGIDLDGVWLPVALLRRLAEHGPWTPPLTEATADQARVLVAHGLAEPHNNGLCRGSGLRNFVDALPFEPTVPIAKVPAADSAVPPQ